MKQLKYLIVALSLLCACDDVEDNYILNPDNIAGTIRHEVILPKGQTYYLDGALVVENGGRLIIEAGVNIIAKGGTSSYVAIAQGGQIFAQGTEQAPIVFTSDLKQPGAWGGLVICGRAPTNKSIVVGTAVKAEVTGLPYGGAEDEDNSGELSYVRVEYSGYSYDDDHQFNGFSFFGVGSATIVNNISSYASADDGIEFFGGYLNSNYVVAINSGDDGFDFADGWQGRGSFWYAYNSAKSGVEGSNNDTNGSATPMTSINLSHLTIYKMGEYPWFLKDGSGSQTVDNLVIGGLAKGVSHPYFYYITPQGNTGDLSTHERVLNGDITFTNVNILDASVALEDIASGSLTITSHSGVIGAGAWQNDTTLAPAWLGTWAMPL